MRAEPILSVRDVAIRFPAAATDAVRDISFDIDAGETLAIFGPSGSGESSLALALSGAIPTLVSAERRGEIRVQGAQLPAGSLSAQIARTASILQDVDAQIVALTVEDEIAFALENRGAPSELIEERIARALSRAPTAGLSRRDRTLALSGGWRQRLAIGAAIAEDPMLLVLDEPVAHLDGDGVAGAMTAVAAARTHDAATIVVEHRCDRIAAVADRALVLRQDGSPALLASMKDMLDAAAQIPTRWGLRLPAALIANEAARRAAETQRERAFVGDAGLAIDALRRRGAILDAVLRALDLEALERPPRAASTPLLAINDADVRRGSKTILQSIDFAVGAGEVVGLTGANGAGKTTLAFLAAGALRAKRGRVVRSGGAPIYLPQNPALAFASNSLAAEAARRRLPWRDVARALTLMELPDDPARHPLAFSHGERRRVGLAFALATQDERLIILDEPVSGLDGFGVAMLRDQLGMLRERGCGVVVIAHDIDFLLGACDRIAALDQGRIALQGSPREVAARVLASDAPLALSEGLAAAAAHGWRGDESAIDDRRH